MKNLVSYKLFESFNNDGAWLAAFEKMLDRPWQEDSEIEIIGQWTEMMEYYNKNWKGKLNILLDYFNRWVIANDEAVAGSQMLSDAFVDMYDELKGYKNNNN